MSIEMLPQNKQSLTGELDLEDRVVFSQAHHQENQEELQRIEASEKLPFFQKLFKPLQKGSLRSVAIMWIRMSLGIGVLMLPFYTSKFGILIGVTLITIGAFLNYLSYVAIFEASFYTEKFNYFEIITSLLGNKALLIFNLTYFLDLSSTVAIYAIVTWKLFVHILAFFGYVKEDWFANLKNLELNDKNPYQYKFRILYFSILFLVTIPLFLKRSMDSLNFITIIYLGVLIFLIFFVFIILKPYYDKFSGEKDSGHWTGAWVKSPSIDWAEYGLVLFIGFYVQPFVFSLRNQLAVPTLRWIKKLTKISLGLEWILFVLIASLGYYVFGDLFTPELFIVRTELYGRDHWLEKFQIMVLGVFFLASTFGLAIYSSSMRDFLGEFINIKSSSFNYVVASLLPFFFICLVSTFFPYLGTIVDLFTYTVFNFNGYIIPCLMGVATYRKYNIKGPKIHLYYAVLVILVQISIYCICVALYQKLSPKILPENLNIKKE